jgi:DNA-binding transcriptional MocR family regulator
VVRVDTFAKLLGPGYRLGWVAGPPAVVERVALHTAAVSVGASSTSQVRACVRWRVGRVRVRERGVSGCRRGCIMC